MQKQYVFYENHLFSSQSFCLINIRHYNICVKLILSAETIVFLITFVYVTTYQVCQIQNHISQHINWICHAVLLCTKFESDLNYNVCAVFHWIGSGSLVLIYHVLGVHIVHVAKGILISNRGRRKNSKHTLLSLNECVWLGFVESSQASYFTGYTVLINLTIEMSGAVGFEGCRVKNFVHIKPPASLKTFIINAYPQRLWRIQLPC